MIKIRFKEILETHRFTIQMIHNDTGINRNTLTDLYYKRTKRIDIDSLNRLCVFFNKYFKCTVADILEFIDN